MKETGYKFSNSEMLIKSGKTKDIDKEIEKEKIEKT